MVEDCTVQKNRLETAKDDFVREICRKVIDCLQKQLKTVKAEMTELTKHNQYSGVVKRLETIPSVGRLTAVMLLNHLVASDFKTANQFVAFAGLAPKIKDSGTSVRGKGGLTKLGNRKLRAALFMPAMVAYRIKAFPDFIQRLEKKKKPKKVIIVALMRKLAVIAYYLYTKGQDYDKTRYQTVSN